MIVPAFLLTSSRSNACGAYLLTALIALIPTNIAYSKGRNFAKWFIYSTFLWIIAIIHSIKITPNDKSRIRAGYHKCLTAANSAARKPPFVIAAAEIYLYNSLE